MSTWSVWQPRALLGVLAVVVAGGSYFAAKDITARRAAAAEPMVTPFAFEAQTYLYRDNPAGQLLSTLEVARRSDGTTVEIRSVGPVARGLYTRVIRFTDGGREDLVDAVKAKTTWPPESAEATAAYRAWVFHPPSDCAHRSETVASQSATILGHTPVVELLDQLVIRNGPVVLRRIRSAQWRAADLGCATLQFRSEELRADGTYELVSEQKPVSLQLGEPDPGLFQAGQGYAEVAPSELAAKIRQLLGYTSPGPAEKLQARIGDPKYKRDWAAYRQRLGLGQ